MRNPIRPIDRLQALAGAAALGICLAASSCDHAPNSGPSEFPRKPIKVIVPFGVGGDSDSFTRIVQKTLRDQGLLPQPLVVINVPGAGGTVGSRRVRDAAPDGYTILNLHEGILSSKYAGRVPYGPEAFRPIAATGQSNLVICVREESRYRDLADLIAAAAKHPDTILFGMAQGTPTHFAGRRLEVAGGTAKFRMVATGGGAKRFNDLVGEHIDATPFALAEYLGFEAGGVRAIAYLAEERHPSLPDLPTARELGFDVVMPHIQYWWAPRSTPDAAVDRIADALEAAMSTRYLLGKLSESRTEPLFLRGEQLEAHLADRESEFQDIAIVRYEGLPDPVPPVIALAAALLLIVSIRSFTDAQRVAATDAPWRYSAVTVATLATYVLAMQFGAPYPLATSCFVPLLGIVAGARGPKPILQITGIGIALAWICFLIFTRVLVIDLP